MEQRRKTLRSLSGVLKDRASLAKASLSFNSRSAIRTAIIRATNHDAASAPKEYRVDALLSLGLGTGFAAEKCIKLLMDRLHKTGNAFVALKCLFAMHNIIYQGSVTLRDQLSTFPSNGGHNFLNLSMFRDNYDKETSEYSSWVRWYSEFLEQTMITSRVLGYYLYPPPPPPSSSSSWSAVRKIRDKRIRASLSSELVHETVVLVDFVQVICKAPDSIQLQKNDLMYEIVRSVCEDYRIIRHEIRSRLIELHGRLEILSDEEFTQLSDVLNQFEDCRGKLFLLFVNRANNDGLWGVVSKTKEKLETIKRRRSNPLISRIICWVPNWSAAQWNVSSMNAEYEDHNVMSQPLLQW